MLVQVGDRVYGCARESRKGEKGKIRSGVRTLFGGRVIKKKCKHKSTKRGLGRTKRETVSLAGRVV